MYCVLRLFVVVADVVSISRYSFSTVCLHVLSNSKRIPYHVKPFSIEALNENCVFTTQHAVLSIHIKPVFDTWQLRRDTKCHSYIFLSLYNIYIYKFAFIERHHFMVIFLIITNF